MGSGISSVCGGSRSVLISNSVRKLPTIHETDTDSETELDINPRSGKLHPAESRDSGIGENDIPNGFMFQKLKQSSNESSPEKAKEQNAANNERPNSRPSRPASCRLGHRGHAGKSRRSQRAEISESQIRRLVRSARGQPGVPMSDGGVSNGDFSDDTLSCASISSLTRDVKTNARPKSARRRIQKRHKGDRDERRNSAKTISDLDSSTDTEISDTDMLSIPDETGAFNKTKDNNTRRQRGWVRNEDFTDVMLTSTSTTPRVDGPSDMYRIVSGTFSDIDVNLAKKASERSISSIILTPMDGVATPTNSECFDSPNEFYYHCDGNLEDLITSLVTALSKQGSRGPCTTSDYEQVIRGLRYQLVGMAMGNVYQQSTPRIEIQGEQSGLFSDDTWRVQIRLRTEDEEIIESSENILVQRLVAKGRHLSREDISILLAEHLKTIEKLQQVQDAGKLGASRNSPLPFLLISPRQQLADDTELQITRPGSASRTKHVRSDQSNATKTVRRELPPLGRKNNKTSSPKGDNSFSSGTETKQEFDSCGSSPETKAKDRRSFNESGIDSEAEDIDLHGLEIEDRLLYSEFTEAVVILWETLTSSDLKEIVSEYRNREGVILSSYAKHQKQTNSHGPGFPEKDIKEGSFKSDGKCVRKEGSVQMGQHISAGDALLAGKEVRDLDEDFVRKFQERQARDDASLDEFCESLDEHMKKTRLIRVQSLNLQEDIDWNANKRAHSFTGFGNSQTGDPSMPVLKRQNSFAGSISRQSSSIGGISRHNSFIRSLPGSRQGSYCRTKSRGSTGSSNTYSTTSSGVSSGLNSVTSSDGSGHFAPKSALSREFSYGLLNEFEDIEELDESVKTAREAANKDSPSKTRLGSDSLRPPSGRKSNGPRATSGNVRERDRRRGQTQMHGLGMTSVENANKPLRRIEEDACALPKVEEIDGGKVMVRSRPDSGIAVSTSSASYSSSEPHKERDLEEPCLTTSCNEMVEKVSKVLAEQHNDMKSLVAAVTKGLNSSRAKAQALYCWLTCQDLANFEKISKKSSSPPGKLKQLFEKKTSYSTIYMDMLKVAGLKCEKVEGYVKSNDYLPGNTVQSQKFYHSWVAVCMDKHHYSLVDPMYGAFGDKFYLDHFFATSPDALILSHFPKDKRWLLMNQPATIEVFEGTVKTWPAMFHFNIRPLNMKSVIKTYDGRLSITVLLQNVAVNPQLEYAGPGKEIDSDTLEEQIDHEIRDVDNAETYHVTLPQEGTYYFTVFAHVLEEGIDVPVFQYKIEYKDELL